MRSPYYTGPPTVEVLNHLNAPPVPVSTRSLEGLSKQTVNIPSVYREQYNELKRDLTEEEKALAVRKLDRWEPTL